MLPGGTTERPAVSIEAFFEVAVTWEDSYYRA